MPGVQPQTGPLNDLHVLQRRRPEFGEDDVQLGVGALHGDRPRAAKPTIRGDLETQPAVGWEHRNLPHPVGRSPPHEGDATTSDNRSASTNQTEEDDDVTDPLTQPNRIAFIGDLHMNARWSAHAIRHAATQDADVIVQLGDFGYTYDAAFMKTVEQALTDTGLHLLFIDGNHECFPTLLRYRVHDNGLRKLTDHIWHLPRGLRWTWAGTRFLALGGAYSVDRPYRVPGASWWRDETITNEQAAGVIADGTADVLISHDCPAGVTIPGIDNRTTPPPFPPLEIMRSDEHRQLLRRVVNAVQPRLIWHGHYHRGYTAHADFGYGPVGVIGLDCDGTSEAGNVQVVDIADIAARVGKAAEVTG